MVTGCEHAMNGSIMHFPHSGGLSELVELNRGLNGLNVVISDEVGLSEGLSDFVACENVTERGCSHDVVLNECQGDLEGCEGPEKGAEKVENEGEGVNLSLKGGNVTPSMEDPGRAILLPNSDILAPQSMAAPVGVHLPLANVTPLHSGL